MDEVRNPIDILETCLADREHGATMVYSIMTRIEKAVELLKEQQPKKGHWIISNQTNIYGATKVTCSNCNDSVMVQYIQDELFCRHCGADMRTVVDR